MALNVQIILYVSLSSVGIMMRKHSCSYMSSRKHKKLNPKGGKQVHI